MLIKVPIFALEIILIPIYVEQINLSSYSLYSSLLTITVHF